MNPDFDRKVLLALLERLNADSRLPEPHYSSVVTQLERDALAGMLGIESQKLEPQVVQPPPIVDEAPPAPTVEPSYTLDLASLSGKQKPDCVVCVDFGTAKSKAFAVRLTEDSDSADSFDGHELNIGKLDNDPDRAVYTVASSVWISNDGLMYAGSDALVHGTGAHDRERLDSIKQQLIQTNHQRTLNRLLPVSVNPTPVKLTYADAMCFYLAYLSDLIGRALENAKLPRYTRRRFTIPAWSDAQRKWANDELKRLLKRAQILADTFKSRWATGIPVAEVKWAVEEASKHDEALKYLLDPVMDSFEFGISEPMAAGSGRIRIDKSTRNLILVVDVGAGTTDFGLFMVNHELRKAFPVEPRSAAVKMAGDYIDSLLVEHIFSKLDGYPDPQSRELIASDLRRTGLRQKKEELFAKGKLDIRLVTGLPVTLDLKEFLATPGVHTFAEHIETQLREFLGRVDSSFATIAEQPTMLLTGGGAGIPFIQTLLEKQWVIAGKNVKFKRALQIPEAIAEYNADFRREYPQLAVAMGGAMRPINEKNSLQTFAGTTARLGPLTRYAVTGPS